MTRTTAKFLLGTFVAGVFVLLPIILTVVIINWLVGHIRNLLGPGSLIGDLLASAGSTVFGLDNDQLSFWIGLSLAIIGIWFIGLVVTLQARKTITGALDALFNRIPFLNSIYRPVAQVVRLLDSQEEGELKGMQVVTVRLGGDTSTDILALQASPTTFTIDGEDRALIYVPTAPVPMGGFLLMIATENVKRVPDMDVDDLMKVYFSVGTLASEAMPPQFQEQS